MQTNQVDQTNARVDYRTSQLVDLRPLLMGRCGYLQSRQPAGARDRRRPGTTWPRRSPEQAGCSRLWPCAQPTKYYELRVGYSRMIQGIYDSGTKYGNIAEELGIPNANGNGAAPGLTTTNITGMTGLGDGAGSLQKVNNNWEIDQAFSWVRNRHELKFGFDYMSRRFAFHSPGAPNGQFTFSGIYSNFGLADFLFGNRSVLAWTSRNSSTCIASISAGSCRTTGASTRSCPSIWGCATIPSRHGRNDMTGSPALFRRTAARSFPSGPRRSRATPCSRAGPGNWVHDLASPTRSLRRPSFVPAAASSTASRRSLQATRSRRMRHSAALS